MSEFNPYREWLGLESKSKPTYYQLLGISRSETDPERVKQRAKTQIRRVLSVAANDRAILRDDIIQRIKRAAHCLSDDERRKEYDRRLFRAMPARETASHRVKPDSEPVRSKPLRRTESPSAALIAGTFSSEKRASQRPIARRLKKQRKQFKAVLICVFLAGLSLLGIGFLLGTQTDLVSGIMGFADTQPAAIHPARIASNGNTEPLAPAADADTRAGNPSAVEDFSPRQRSSSKEEITEPADHPWIPVNSAELRELGRLLATARAALTNRRFDEARKLLGAASALARRPEEKSKYDRLVLLTKYVEGYWNAANDGLRQLRAGEELMVMGMRIMVVEKNDKELILRIEGQNKTYSVRDLPLHLQMHFADRWFDSSAASTKVFRGAMMAVSPDFDKDEARQLWRAAQLSGDVDIGDLELVLEDTYDLVP